VPSIAAPEKPRISPSEDSPLIAQSRRRKRRRGRRSRTAKPTKKAKKKAKKSKKKAKNKAKSDKKEAKKSAKKSKPDTKTSKKKVKKKKSKKKAPKVTKKKGPLLPKNFGKIVMYSGAGLTAVGLGVAGWGATIHNDAVSERHRLQDREANSKNQEQAFWDLHSDMETGKTVHFTGLGIAGFAVLTVAVGSLF